MVTSSLLTVEVPNLETEIEAARLANSAAEKISLSSDNAAPKADIVVSPAPDTSNTS